MTERATQRPAARNMISGDFFTPAYRMTGKIAVGNAGLIGLLNDAVSSLAELEDVYISRVSNSAKIVARYSLGRIAKARLELILLNRREDVGPIALGRGGFSKVVEHPVMVSTPTFEIKGTLEQPGRLDIPSLLVEGSGKFFLLHKATIVPLVAPDSPFTAASVLINRARVDLFCAQSEAS